MPRRPGALSFGLLSLGLAACGGTSLSRPADLRITDYPANSSFTLTLEMQRCRLSCDRYTDAGCEVSVDEDERLIRVSPSVEVERIDDAPCAQDCGGAAVLAHCEVGALEAGEWTVESNEGLFSRVITLR